MKVLHHKSGFTLLEVIIVLSVIGILSTLSYPSIATYLGRGDDLNAQLIQRDVVSLLSRYRLDHGEISGQATQSGNNLIETYYIPYDNATANAGMWEVHVGLKELFQSTPEGLRALDYTQKSGRYVFPIMLASLYYVNTNWGYTFPGLDMTDTKKIPLYYWWNYSKNHSYLGRATTADTYFAAYDGYPEGYYREWYIQGTSLGKDVDSMCAPGIASYVYVDTNNNSFIECDYLFLN